MPRVFNFSAGPAMLPLEVLEASAKLLVEIPGKGFGIAECSHRGKEFDAVMDQCLARCRSLLAVPDTHDILMMQGGATALFTIIAQSFAHGGLKADYLVSGEWSQKAAKAAPKGVATVVASSETTGFDRSPEAAEWKLNSDAAYFHVCSNETVHGHRLPTWPTHPNLIVDASSEFMSRPHPIASTAVVYAGAQKNLGPAGVVVAIVRKDVYSRIPATVPGIWHFQKLAEAKSMVNTPPTFGIAILNETFGWMERQGGLAAIEQVNAKKAGLIYDAVDASGGFYKGTVAVTAQRSHMNATFRLPTAELDDAFVKQAEKLSMVALKGYRTVGGIRASIYNAMPTEGCRLLAEFMADFAKKNG